MLHDKSKKKPTIIDSGITKQKDIKLVIQMKCNLELWCKSFAFKNEILYIDKNVYILIYT